MAGSDSRLEPHAPVVTRWAPDKPLPPYTYVTGKYPHPTRDRQGHAFGQDVEPPVRLDPDRWQDCHGYLFGVDLFNHGYYWEAHEAWEEVWHAHGRIGPMADFLKALIKLAAAGVKAREGRVEGVRRHAIRARQLLVQSQAALARRDVDHVAGLSMIDLRHLCERLEQRADDVVDDSDCSVVVVMPVALRPKRSQ